MKRRILIVLMLAWTIQPLITFATPKIATEGGSPFPFSVHKLAMLKPLPQPSFTEAKVVEAIYVAPTVATVSAPAPVGDSNSWLVGAGISPGDYGYVDYIISRESGWCPTKWQGQHTCPDNYYPTLDLNDGWVGYGLCQSTPGIKMATAGADFATNGVTQMKWCNSYAITRYGSWAAAYNYWLVHHNW